MLTTKATSGDEALEERVESWIASAPRLRESFDAKRHGRKAFVVSGWPTWWDRAADLLAGAGSTVVAFQDVRGTHPGKKFDRPIIKGRIPTTLASHPVLFAGAPNKHWFNPSPPGPEQCVWQVDPADWQQNGRHTPQLWTIQRYRMLELFRMLADEESGVTLASIVRARLEGDSSYHRISRFTEYDHPIVRAEPGDVVIDGGAYEGDITRMYSERVGVRGRVYALEPDPKNYVPLAKMAQSRGNVVPLCVGVWSDSTLMKFSAGKGASSMVSEEGETSIALTSIDSLVDMHRIEKVDLIKLDVEGAEAEAIRGAEQTIRKFRPKLQISIYHKVDDLFELPELLRPLLPNYRFYLGHHSYYQMETDLYAIPYERWVRSRVHRIVRRTSRRLGQRAFRLVKSA